MKEKRKMQVRLIVGIASAAILTGGSISSVLGAPVEGGSLDPLSIPKYVTPLVIPPVMNTTGVAEDYDIAVRQFQQQILPGGIWNTINGRTDAFQPTTVWSYGPTADPMPDSTALGGAAGVAPAPNSQFNYPAYTFETTSNVGLNVTWRNDLVDANGNYLPHLLPVDQTLHWANPMRDCRPHGGHPAADTTDCSGTDDQPYTGPVPIITHVHGAHVGPESDGYPEAWYLPAANDIPAGYSTSGSLFDDITGNNPGNLGYADFFYPNDQPATTLWYHDHSLGMTRLNVYAGPAGFWLIRGGMFDGAFKFHKKKSMKPATLPGPAPVAGQDVLSLNIPGNPARDALREIPIVIQDRSFNADGSLWYPADRAHFEGLTPEQLQIPFVNPIDGDATSDIAPIWNPEAFFNVMVVNGVSWPNLDVAQSLYRFRLLNGCNSRFLNLALHVVNPDGTLGQEIPFYQIGAEQGFLKDVVEVQTGFATVLDGTDKDKAKVKTPANHPQQALLVTLAERADVLVDFSGLPDGTIVQMTNTAPDAPFGGFPDVPADPSTTGQVMQFTVNGAMNLPTDMNFTPPHKLVLNAEPSLTDPVATYREVSLNEGESELLCVDTDALGNVIHVVDPSGILPNLPADGCPLGGVPFAPKEALVGIVDWTGNVPSGVGLKWTDMTGNSTPTSFTMADGSVRQVNVTENPLLGDTEIWDIYNFTADAHPIHLHLVRFEVLGRVGMDGAPAAMGSLQPWESGYKDTVISYPGEITTVKAKFDVAGLYVWHCHIVEHEDNEMMRPYVVSDPNAGI